MGRELCPRPEAHRPSASSSRGDDSVGLPRSPHVRVNRRGCVLRRDRIPDRRASPALSGDRPSRLKPQDLELYVKLLEAVAVKYGAAGRLFGDGYFAVGDQDQVSVSHRGDIVSVPVQRLLNRSGLVNLDPLRPGIAHYRFEPFWFHRLLIQMHGERRAGGGEKAERQRQAQSDPQPDGEKT